MSVRGVGLTRVCLLVTLMLPAAAQALPAEVPVLAVDEAAGAMLDRDDKVAVLKSAAVLRQGDTVTSAAQPASLRLHRSGRLELGPQSRLRLEKLPHSSFAGDLSTVLNLEAGYLHVTWKRPGAGTSWPLSVYFGDVLLGLSSGEFFFEASETQRLCIAGGELSWAIEGNTRTMKGPACYRLERGMPVQRSARTSADFIGMRAQDRLPDAASWGGIVESPRAEEATDATAQESAVAVAPVVAEPVEEPAPESPAIVIPAAVEPVMESPIMTLAVPPAAAQAVNEPVRLHEWVVNVSSVSDPTTAERQAARVRAIGYEPVVQVAQVGARYWYRIQLPGIASQEAARALAHEIENKLGIPGVWIAKR